MIFINEWKEYNELKTFRGGLKRKKWNADAADLKTRINRDNELYCGSRSAISIGPELGTSLASAFHFKLNYP